MTVTKQQQLERISRIIPKWNDAYQYAELMTNPSINMTVYRFTDNPSGDNALITREEWQQERDKMQKQQDNSWHERGELPPVGATVEKKYKSATIWTEIKIVAAGNQLVIFGYPDGDESVGEWSDYEFRPLRTEREKAIDEMVSGYQSAKGDKPVHPRVRAFAEYLYDAGYRKVKP